MSATIVVLPNRRFATIEPAMMKIDGHGGFEIKDVPVGTWTLFAYSRRAEHPASAKVTVAAGTTVEANLALDEVRRDFSHPNKYGERYPDDPAGYPSD
jgi:hypothetical protein